MITYTVSDVARILKRSRPNIVNLIQSRRLKAFDAAPDGRKRQWRVTGEWLTQFMSQNAARPAPKRTRSAAKPARRWV